MIKNSKQDWSEGSAVKVGFMTLVVVCAVKTPGDYAPDAYLLRNVNGTKLYRFVPHLGLTEVTLGEASAMQDEADRQGTTAHGRLMAAAKAKRPVCPICDGTGSMSDGTYCPHMDAFAFATPQAAESAWAQWADVL